MRATSHWLHVAQLLTPPVSQLEPQLPVIEHPAMLMAMAAIIDMKHVDRMIVSFLDSGSDPRENPPEFVERTMREKLVNSAGIRFP